MIKPSTPLQFDVSYKTEDDTPCSQRFNIHVSEQTPLLPTQPAMVFQRPALGQWSLIAGRADEWFLAHLQASTFSGRSFTMSPWAFAAGHALELYLKAAESAHSAPDAPIKFKHLDPSLWDRCEAYPGFPFKGLLHRDLLDLNKDIYDQKLRTRLPVSVQRHLSENELLYLALRHVQDLKYLGMPGKTIKANGALTFLSTVPNKTVILQLGLLAQWVWGPWCGKPGYNWPDIYSLANVLLQR